MPTPQEQYILELTRAQTALTEAEKHLRVVPAEVLRDGISIDLDDSVRSDKTALYTTYFPRITQITTLTKNNLEQEAEKGAD